MGNRIILVGSEKGGVGKTTIAFNLAVMRVKAGKPVLLIDADKQASSSMYASLRAEGDYQPPLMCVQKSGKIGLDLVQFRSNYEVIVDAGGADSIELRQGIAVADFWIIPVRLGQLDLFPMAKMRQLMTEVEERIGRIPTTRVVLNAVSPTTKEAEEARERLAEDSPETPVLTAQLGDRVAVRRAVMTGCGVIELEGRNANATAEDEFKELYAEIFGEPYEVKES